MRLITQNGLWDIPYEKVVVIVDFENPNTIKAYESFNTNTYVELGKYNNITDVRVVTEKMRTAYRDGKSYFYFP